MASVSLDVRSGEHGGLLEDADVVFTVDGGPERSPEDADAGSFVLAYEDEGTFEVTVTAPGHEQVERTYEIGRTTDDCHVEGVSDTVVLAVQE